MKDQSSSKVTHTTHLRSRAERVCSQLGLFWQVQGEVLGMSC